MSDERSYLGYDFGDEDGWMDGCWNSSLVEDDKDIATIQYLLNTGQSFTGHTGRSIFPNQPSAPPAARNAGPQIPKQINPPPAVTASQQPTVPPPPQLSPHPQTPTPAPADSTVPSLHSVPEPPATTPSKPSATKARKGRKDKHKCTNSGCSQVFDTKTALSIHVGRIHKGDSKEKTYQCTTCYKSFHNSSYLSQHMKIHSGDKPYVCSVKNCGKKFIQLSHKQQHERTHTGEKPYSCKHPGCDKSFSQLSNLQSHTRSHLPENLVKCSSCYKCFKSEQALEKHTKIAHLAPNRQRAHQCPICSKTYTQDTYLRSHMVKKHGREAADGALKVDQDTSVQAATDMCADLKDPRNDDQATNSAIEKMPVQAMSAGINHGFDGYNNYIRAAAATASQSYPPPSQSVQPQYPPSTSRREFDGQGSAFKPLSRATTSTGALDSIETLALQSRQVPMTTPQTTNNLFDQTKNQSANQAEKEMFYQQFRMAANYSQYNNYLQTYNNSTFTNFMNAPLPDSYTDKIGNVYSYQDKAATAMFSNEAMSDFLMGGLRDSFGMD